jgi:hypothetical protein
MSPRASFINTTLSRDSANTWGRVTDQPGGIDRFLYDYSDITLLQEYPYITDAKNLRSVNGQDVLAPESYLEGLGFGQTGYPFYPAIFLAPSTHLLDLLRVTTFLSDGTAATSPRAGAIVSGGQAVRNTKLVRYEYAPKLPDVYLVGSTRVASTPDVLAAIDGVTPFDPAATAYVEAGCDECASLNRPGRAGDVRGGRWGQRSLSVDVAADRPALLVVSQAWYRGWEATVDGARAPVVRTDAILQGVPVPAGVHHVELRYRAPGLLAGEAVTGLTIVALLAAIIERRRREHQVRRKEPMWP